MRLKPVVVGVSWFGWGFGWEDRAVLRGVGSVSFEIYAHGWFRVLLPDMLVCLWEKVSRVFFLTLLYVSGLVRASSCS